MEVPKVRPPCGRAANVAKYCPVKSVKNIPRRIKHARIALTGSRKDEKAVGIFGKCSIFVDVIEVSDSERKCLNIHPISRSMKHNLKLSSTVMDILFPW